MDFIALARLACFMRGEHKGWYADKYSDIVLHMDRLTWMHNEREEAL